MRDRRQGVGREGGERKRKREKEGSEHILIFGTVLQSKRAKLEKLLAVVLDTHIKCVDKVQKG